MDVSCWKEILDTASFRPNRFRRFLCSTVRYSMCWVSDVELVLFPSAELLWLPFLCSCLEVCHPNRSNTVCLNRVRLRFLAYSNHCDIRQNIHKRKDDIKRSNLHFKIKLDSPSWHFFKSLSAFGLSVRPELILYELHDCIHPAQSEVHPHWQRRERPDYSFKMRSIIYLLQT